MVCGTPMMKTQERRLLKSFFLLICLLTYKHFFLHIGTTTERLIGDRPNLQNCLLMYLKCKGKKMQVLKYTPLSLPLLLRVIMRRFMKLQEKEVSYSILTQARESNNWLIWPRKGFSEKVDHKETRIGELNWPNTTKSRNSVRVTLDVI